MSTLYQLPAYEQGCKAARWVIEANIEPNAADNPYTYDTEEWKAWNLGWNTTLRAEQP